MQGAGGGVVDGAAVVAGAWHAAAELELRQVCTTSEEASSAAARMSKHNRKTAAMHAQFIATSCDST